MNIFYYFKERRYMFLAFIVAAVFSLSVYWANGSKAVLYAFQGTGLCFLIFTIADYFVMRFRIRNMERFLNQEQNITFSYPLDSIYSEKIDSVIKKYEKYKDDMQTQHSEELDFITKWVHDVKIPISAIKLISESLEEASEEQLEMQIFHIEQNIKEILFHIKSKRFCEDYTIKMTDVKTIINRALKQFAVFFLYKRIALDIRLESFFAATDDKWSEYIVSQIISNAVKYTPQGGRIEISTYVQQDKGIIAVKNTGAGIDENSIKDIFKRGFSGSSVRSGMSTGYGLYLSKKLADIMGHRLYVESVPGKYTLFTLVFNITKM